MKILTETRDLLIVEDSTSKNAFITYVILMMLVNIIIIIYITIMLGIFPLWASLVLIIVDIIMIPTTTKIKVIVDKKDKLLKVFENHEERYRSNYPLTKIKSIKILSTFHYSLLTYHTASTSLIAVLENDQNKTLISSKVLGPFYIDVEANKQARIGRKIAEFLEVPFHC